MYSRNKSFHGVSQLYAAVVHYKQFCLSLDILASDAGNDPHVATLPIFAIHVGAAYRVL